MGEGRVKTAIELAMEKVAAMPKLDSEEIKKQEEEKLISQGYDVVQKYVNFPTKKRHNLSDELKGFEGLEKKALLRGMINGFRDFLSLTDLEQNQYILQGVIQVFERINLSKFQKSLESIHNDFLAALNKAYAKMEKEEIKNLKRWGVHGSAVRPNLLVSEEWRAISDEIETAFQQNFSQMKDELTSEALR